MIYESMENKTYFWFSNASTIPGFVKIKLKNLASDKVYDIGPYRISPDNQHLYQFKKTATSFDFLEGNLQDRTELTLNINIMPAFDDNKIESNFTKSYRFNKLELRWDETTWGYPDPVWPVKI